MKKEVREIRIIPLSELRITKHNDEDPVMEGYAARFNTWSDDLGYFKERIKPGAFKSALKSSDTRALFNHDSNFVLGRKSAKTLKLEENSVGLRFQITPPDTQWARDLILSINRKDISQMSFGFIVKEDKWEEDKDGNVSRTIIEFDELLDVSPVTFPAYPDTKVALRDLEEFRSKHKPGADTGNLDLGDKTVKTHRLEIKKRKHELKKKLLIIKK